MQDKMQEEIIQTLKQIADSGNREDLRRYIRQLENQPRTQEQHNALFLWFGMIEREAENQGVTWDRLIKHTHQLKVTKQNLHDAWKQLQKALFKTDSTKKLKKHQQIDICIDHFVDWFSKEGLELPPFPNNPKKTSGSVMEDIHKKFEDYPEYKEPTI